MKLYLKNLEHDFIQKNQYSELLIFPQKFIIILHEQMEGITDLVRVTMNDFNSLWNKFLDFINNISDSPLETLSAWFVTYMVYYILSKWTELCLLKDWDKFTDKMRKKIMRKKVRI